MRILVTVHGLMTAAVADPGGQLVLTLPEEANIQALIELLYERSPLFDPRSSLAVIDGVRVPLDQALQDGDHVHLYPIFGGG